MYYVMCMRSLKALVRLADTFGIVIGPVKQTLNVNSIYFLSISLDMCFRLPKKTFYRDCSFEYPQHMFWLRNKKKISYAILYGA